MLLITCYGFVIRITSYLSTLVQTKRISSLFLRYYIRHCGLLMQLSTTIILTELMKIYKNSFTFIRKEIPLPKDSQIIIIRIRIFLFKYASKETVFKKETKNFDNLRKRFFQFFYLKLFNSDLSTI